MGYTWISLLSRRPSTSVPGRAQHHPRVLFPSLTLSSQAKRMASLRSSLLLRGFFHVSPLVGLSRRAPASARPARIDFGWIRCHASEPGDGVQKVPARFSMMQQLLQDAEERSLSAGSEPTPKITLDHVTITFARSGGPGGQNVNKVNTKVDMRFNVRNAHWLSERVRERILQMEKNRINKDGELVISSTKTRTQKGNIDDALEKLQAIVDSASYVPPPPSEEQKKRIEKLAAIEEKKRMQNKKALSQKKDFRRSRDSWD